VTVSQRDPSCAGSHFHPLTNLTGHSHKIVCQYRGRPGQAYGRLAWQRALVVGPGLFHLWEVSG
jgi:hypothetical protein